MSKLLTLIGVAALIVFLIAIGPILVIWALNTLFPGLAIELTVWTWLAVIVLGAFISPNVTIRRKNG